MIVLKSLVITLLLLFSVNAGWAGQYGRMLCKMEGYECLRVKRGETWESLFPDVHDREIEKRINRLNIPLWAGMVIAVPDELEEAEIMDFSPFPHHIPPRQEKLIVVDPTVDAWGAYDAKGQLVYWGPSSSGKAWCTDVDQSCKTHPGAYRIFSLGSSDCYSHQFPLPDGGAPMPYCMYFNNGQALHGEPNGLPGDNSSHGCVRLFVNDAEWLRYDFVEGPTASNHYRGTEVLIRNY